MDVVEIMGNASAKLKDAETELLNDLGADSYSNAFLNAAHAVAEAAGMKPTAEMGCAHSVFELHPGMFDQEKVKGLLTFEQVLLLTPAERLAFAATGAYEGSEGTVPSNLMQLFGYAGQFMMGHDAFANALASAAHQCNEQITMPDLY